MRGSFVNNTNKAVDDAYSELLPTTGKRKGVLQSALSDKEWGQRLNPPSRKAKEVERKPSNASIKVFPGVPFFSIGRNTFFVIPDNFKTQDDAAHAVSTARENGPHVKESERGHWITSHYAVSDAHGLPESFQQSEGTEEKTAYGVEMEKRAAAGGAVVPPSAPSPPRLISYRPYPTPHPIPPQDPQDPEWLPLASDDPEHRPDWRFTKLYTHVLPKEPNQFDVEVTQLKVVLDSAEQADYRFALRMQGLQNSTLEAVWPGCDRHNGERDITDVTNAFLKQYMTKFLQRWATDFDGTCLPVEVIRESIHMHKLFTQQWDVEHKRNLSPAIQAGAEMLVGLFYKHPALQEAVTQNAPWGLISRYFSRHEKYSAIFSLCLHSSMVKMEQDRGSRNANYKSMVNATSTYVASMNTMHTFLTKNTREISDELRILLGQKCFELHKYFIDWHWVASELPVGHTRFRQYQLDFGNQDRDMDDEDLMQDK